MSVKKLSILTSCLFMVSLGVYFKENYRSSHLASGGYYIKGLDPSKVQKISLNFEKDKEISFVRDQNQFTLSSHKSYPAATNKINDLIYQIASIQIKDKVASSASEEDLKQYGLTEETKKYKVDIFDGGGKKTQSFYVGKKQKSRGNYLLKEGSNDVYLSDSSIWIDSSYKGFIDRVIVDIDKDSVEKVLVNSGETIEIEKKEKEFILVNPKKEAKKEKLESYMTSFKQTRFEDFFKHNEDKVRDISFDKEIKVSLSNKLTYDLNLGQKKGEYFIKALALASQVPNKVVISQDADKDELEGVGNMIEAKQKADEFNIKRGAWVYRIDKSDYEKLIKKSSDFM